MLNYKALDIYFLNTFNAHPMNIQRCSLANVGPRISVFVY